MAAATACSASQTFAQENVESLQATYDYIVENGLDDVVAQGLDYFESHDDAYGSTVYLKGSLFYHQLRLEIGDEAFFTALQNYYADNQYRISSEQTVEDAFSTETDKPLDAFYALWLHNTADSATTDTDTALLASSDVDAETDAELFGRLSKLFKVFAENAEQIWSSDYRLDQMPLLLVYKNSSNESQYGYLINHPDAAELESAELVELDPALNLPPVYKLTTFPSNRVKNVQNFDFQAPIADVSTFVMAYKAPSVDRYSAPSGPDWDAFIAHEGLHDQQAKSWAQGLQVQDVDNYPLDGDAIAAIQLENKLLLVALQTEDAQIREKALQQFVAVRSARIDDNPLAQMMDGEQERIEGTARYIEYNLAKFIPNPEQYSAEGYLEGALKADAGRNELAFGRFYATGAALGFMLDDLAVDWKPAVENGQSQYEVLSDYYGLSDDANAKATLLAEAHADYDYEAMRAAAAKTAETVDADYQALIPGGSYEGEDGDSGDLGGGIIEDIQKEVDPNVVAAVSSSLPTGYDFLGGFNAEADEVEADLYRVDYTPGNTPFTVTNYGSNDGIIRISSAAFDGTLADGKAVSDAVLAKYDIPDVRENSTMGGVAVLVADYGDPTYGPFTSVVFVYNGTWYSVAGSITVEQATTIVQELIGQ